MYSVKLGYHSVSRDICIHVSLTVQVSHYGMNKNSLPCTTHYQDIGARVPFSAINPCTNLPTTLYMYIKMLSAYKPENLVLISLDFTILPLHSPSSFYSQYYNS